MVCKKENANWEPCLMLLSSHELRKAIALRGKGSRETGGTRWHHPWVGLWRHSVESLRLPIWRWYLEQDVLSNEVYTYATI